MAADFKQKLVDRANSTKVGWELRGDVDMGPLIDAKAWDRVDGLVKDAVARRRQPACRWWPPGGAWRRATTTHRPSSTA